MNIYPQALGEHLEREVTTACHCWRLTRRDGVVCGFTDHDRTLTVDGTLFEPESGFSATEARTTLGLSVDTVDVEGALSSSRIRDEDISAGLYDSAKVETLLVNWRKPEDFALLRVATIGKITRSDQRFVADLEGLSYSLDRPGGRYIVRACDAELGDARCGFQLEQSGYAGAGAVLEREGSDAIVVSGLDAFAPGWFVHGALVWTAGARTGRSERIVGHSRQSRGVMLALEYSPLPPIGEGDTFSVKAGCDKTFATCKAKFSNAANFRGFPHLPGNDAAYGYVVDGGQFDGGPIVP